MNFITQHLPKRKETSEKLNNSKLVSILALWKKKKEKKNKGKTNIHRKLVLKVIFKSRNIQVDPTHLASVRGPEGVGRKQPSLGELGLSTSVMERQKCVDKSQLIQNKLTVSTSDFSLCSHCQLSWSLGPRRIPSLLAFPQSLRRIPSLLASPQSLRRIPSLLASPQPSGLALALTEVIASSASAPRAGTSPHMFSARKLGDAGQVVTQGLTV